MGHKTKGGHVRYSESIFSLLENELAKFNFFHPEFMSQLLSVFAVVFALQFSLTYTFNYTFLSYLKSVSKCETDMYLSRLVLWQDDPVITEAFEKGVLHAKSIEQTLKLMYFLLVLIMFAYYQAITKDGLLRNLRVIFTWGITLMAMASLSIYTNIFFFIMFGIIAIGSVCLLLMSCVGVLIASMGPRKTRDAAICAVTIAICLGNVVASYFAHELHDGRIIFITLMPGFLMLACTIFHIFYESPLTDTFFRSRLPAVRKHLSVMLKLNGEHLSAEKISHLAIDLNDSLLYSGVVIEPLSPIRVISKMLQIRHGVVHLVFLLVLRDIMSGAWLTPIRHSTINPLHNSFHMYVLRLLGASGYVLLFRITNRWTVLWSSLVVLFALNASYAGLVGIEWDDCRALFGTTAVPDQIHYLSEAIQGGANEILFAISIVDLAERTPLRARVLLHVFTIAIGVIIFLQLNSMQGRFLDDREWPYSTLYFYMIRIVLTFGIMVMSYWYRDYNFCAHTLDQYIAQFGSRKARESMKREQIDFGDGLDDDPNDEQEPSTETEAGLNLGSSAATPGDSEVPK